MSRRRIKFTGFSLVELIIAIAILSTGIVFVLQAFSFSVKATAVSCDMIEAVLLAKDKMQELDFKERTKTVLEGQNQTKGIKDKFNWAYTLDLDNDTNLYRLKLDVSWKTQNRNEKLDIYSYLR